MDSRQKIWKHQSNKIPASSFCAFNCFVLTKTILMMWKRKVFIVFEFICTRVSLLLAAVAILVLSLKIYFGMHPVFYKIVVIFKIPPGFWSIRPLSLRSVILRKRFSSSVISQGDTFMLGTSNTFLMDM